MTDPDFSAPANAVIRHERHRLDDGKPTIFAKKPSMEVDLAWDDLLKGELTAPR